MTPEPQANWRVLLVEDHPVFADALMAALAGLGSIQVVDHEASLAGAKQRLASGHSYQLILLDLELADASGDAAVVDLRSNHPGLPVVIVSGHEDPATIHAAFQLGVRGYIPKTSTAAVMLQAINMVLAGGSYIPPYALAAFEPAAAGKGAAAPAANPFKFAFSPRQAEVLQLLLQGNSNKVIAARLGMAEGTVKTHLNTIYRLLGAHNRVQVILRAGQLGML